MKNEPSQEVVPYTIRFPRDVFEGIKRVAAREDRSVAGEIRQTLKARIAESDAHAMDKAA